MGILKILYNPKIIRQKFAGIATTLGIIFKIRGIIVIIPVSYLHVVELLTERNLLSATERNALGYVYAATRWKVLRRLENLL